ncbi:Zn-dependent hydrolase [Siminovitchia sp. FSL H7-0308]|uniref:N-carbamoyl-L-amino-acid hydrolase n=1 Tax=Siminovitchia thermophila TaxID=1245522 RepID=A0ABS2RAR7_9BACI|nr:Zn-dependent hydrolase [Siminovitchia thermophila]MBM7715696.1 N-carbamoyl-L-amino-acid hydrolase [Siminovitchia thermophila]ONK25199.1 Zn-dependent hydrolase [Bacillus sp. VT-16-64]
MEKTLLKVNRERLLETIKISSSIGSSAHGGLHRLALSEADKNMRDIFVDWLKAEGLAVRIDDFGNIYGRRKGKKDNGPSVAIGSHLDTQPCGGKYDGILGVLTALEVIRVLNENDIETEYPVEIINFTNEEGARFAPPMLGSGGITGNFTKDFIYHIKDDEGISFEQALKDIGYMGDSENRLKNIKNFIELHIEQGPILHEQEKTIGVVQGIQGNDWYTVKVAGKTNHAGPTPMENRQDALVAASKMIVKVNEIANDIKGLKTTVGKMDVTPNVTNVIPGEVVFTIDIRHEDNELRSHAFERLKEQLSAIALISKVELTITTDWNSETTLFAPVVKDAVKEAVTELGYSSMELFSGPGHDAKYMAEVADTGMIFVPSVDGISHNEQELTLDDDIEKGANVLLYVVQKLAGTKK